MPSSDLCNNGVDGCKSSWKRLDPRRKITFQGAPLRTSIAGRLFLNIGVFWIPITRPFRNYYLRSIFFSSALQFFLIFLFRTRDVTALPVRRLWCYLVRQEKVQDIFIRLVFGKKHVTPHTIGTSNVDSVSVYSDAAGQGKLV